MLFHIHSGPQSEAPSHCIFSPLCPGSIHSIMRLKQKQTKTTTTKNPKSRGIRQICKHCSFLLIAHIGDMAFAFHVFVGTRFTVIYYGQLPECICLSSVWLLFLTTGNSAVKQPNSISEFCFYFCSVHLIFCSGRQIDFQSKIFSFRLYSAQSAEGFPRNYQEMWLVS